MIALERAVDRGFVRATNSDYRRKREGELSRGRPRRRGRDDLGRLRADLTSLGFVTTGPSPDGPLSQAA